jgi:hypothetical protein
MEFEFIAFAAEGKEVKWLQNLLLDIKFTIDASNFFAL